MLAIIGTSGKLGFATLNALLDHNLVPAHEILCTTSSDTGYQKLTPFEQQGIKIKTGINWDSPSSLWEDVLTGTDKLFLISSARIEKDFHDAPPGQGREADHFKALQAAKKVGVKHIYYTSLAFANPSKSRVMKAHERTEEWLRNSGLRHTIVREGLYNESWPLYFGHYTLPHDDRTEVTVAGDGKINWTSIPNLGLANAIILSSPSDEWAGKMCNLAQERAHTLSEVAEMVEKARGKEVQLRVAEREEHERFYVRERGMDEGMVRWWSRTYDALKENECEIRDGTLERLLKGKGVKPKPLEETVREMLLPS